MSQIATYEIPCPKCKNFGTRQIFHSINTSIDNVAQKILNDEINFIKCDNCQNTFQVKTGLLFNNMVKQYALYYNPKSFEGNEIECQNLKTMFGENFYLANPLRFYDWKLFKDEIIRKEGITSSINFKNDPERYSRYQAKTTLDNYWSCNICDGNSDTGCLYFDPTKCPKFS